jgi:hypothetical protein
MVTITLDDAKKAIKGLNPLGDPIGLIDFKKPGYINKPNPINNANENVATGLSTKNTSIYYVNEKYINEDLKVLHYREKQHVDLYYDCDDRALWGIAHLRHKYPGVPIGIASGARKVGEPHAVIVFWDDNGPGPYYWDPNKQGIVAGPKKDGWKDYYKDLWSVIAFPLGTMPDIKDPFNKFGPPPFKNLGYFFDENYLVYKWSDLKDYLAKKMYEDNCEDQAFHKEIYKPEFEPGGHWKDYDRALWVLVHMRRGYPGCAAGIAIGQKVAGKSSAVVIIWQFENDDSKSNPVAKEIYWDPKTFDLRTDFKPESIIY